MRILGQSKSGAVYFFAPRKKEDTTKALDRICDLFPNDSITYVGITSYEDLRKNGFRDEVQTIANKIDFNTHNLIIVQKC